MSGGHKHVGLRNVVHDPMAIAMAKAGVKSANVKLKPIVLDMKGRPVVKK
jgi:hypothetical protein